VKELCRVMQFGLRHQDESGESLALLNFSMTASHAGDYVTAIQKAAGVRRSPLNLPRSLLLGIPTDSRSCIVVPDPATHQPVRVRKLFRSTSIDPRGLRQLGYPWKSHWQSSSGLAARHSGGFCTLAERYENRSHSSQMLRVALLPAALGSCLANAHSQDGRGAFFD